MRAHWSMSMCGVPELELSLAGLRVAAVVLEVRWGGWRDKELRT